MLPKDGANAELGTLTSEFDSFIKNKKSSRYTSVLIMKKATVNSSIASIKRSGDASFSMKLTKSETLPLKPP